MGARSPDNIPAAEWREAYWTVGRMIEGRWRVTAYCDLCDLRVRVRLDLMRRARGADAVLWGQTLACPRELCTGRMQIEGWARGRTAPLDVSRPR